MDGWTKATSMPKHCCLCLLVDKVLRSEGPETLLFVCGIFPIKEWSPEELKLFIFYVLEMI